MTTGQKIKTLMIANRISATKLAEIVGISNVYVSNIINDKVDNPGKKIMDKIAETLNSSVPEIWYSEETLTV